MLFLSSSTSLSSGTSAPEAQTGKQKQSPAVVFVFAFCSPPTPQRNFALAVVAKNNGGTLF